MYGIKDAGCTWSTHLKTDLLARGWEHATINKYLYVKQDILIILYVDNACILSPSQDTLAEI